MRHHGAASGMYLTRPHGLDLAHLREEGPAEPQVARGGTDHRPEAAGRPPPRMQPRIPDRELPPAERKNHLAGLTRLQHGRLPEAPQHPVGLLGLPAWEAHVELGNLSACRGAGVPHAHGQTPLLAALDGRRPVMGDAVLKIGVAQAVAKGEGNRLAVIGVPTASEALVIAAPRCRQGPGRPRAGPQGVLFPLGEGDWQLA
mmetsp:Transcript_30772/g.96825  ORF Transcript_30772/g.96825 Transcript_30772/m.96825 type:complete len:201 (-) Transcript_30772:187-789(-)